MLLTINDYKEIKELQITYVGLIKGDHNQDKICSVNRNRFISRQNEQILRFLKHTENQFRTESFTFFFYTKLE